MTQKILLTSGCSYTNEKYISNDPNADVDFPKWPEIMAKELGLKCINKGRSGKGNDYIFDSLIEQIETYKDRIDTVAVLWTSADRTPFFDLVLNPSVEISRPWEVPGKEYENPLAMFEEVFGDGGPCLKFFQSDYFYKENTFLHLIKSPLMKMSSLIKICDYHNIKLVMGLGLEYFSISPINQAVEQGHLPLSAQVDALEIFRMFSKNSFFAHLEKNQKQVIGWPFFRQMGGFIFDDHRFKDMEKYSISEIDLHPNKEGHEIFAKIFIERYKELYG